MDGQSPDPNGFGLFIRSGLLALSGGTGNAGNIVVEAPRVVITSAGINSNTGGPGQGGSIRVTATDSLTIEGATFGTGSGESPSGLSARTVGTGNAGNIVVEAPRVTLTGGAQIATDTDGTGQGGSIWVMATDTLALAGTSRRGVFISGLFAGNLLPEFGFTFASGMGNAGSIIVEAPRVILTGGAQINSSTRGPGQGGSIRVTATDTLTLAGASPKGLGSSLTATTLGTGNAGSIVVEAPRVALTGGAQINGSTSGAGQGGMVMVTTADTLTITGRASGLRTAATGSGRGGDIAVDAQQARLTAGAVISAESAGTGNAGSITITVHDTFLSQHSTVTTTASQAKGGNIRVTAPAMVRLQESQITATVGGGTGDGGNVTIDPNFILLQGSRITADAFAGTGGRISLTASQALLADPRSVITASSTMGINGQVAIQSPVTNISGAVAPLPPAFTQATELQQSRCAERLRQGRVSRLVVGGRDGVPLEPGSLLLSPLPRVDQETSVQTGQQQLQNPEPQHAWVLSAQAHVREGEEGECARWRSQLGHPGGGGSKRRK